MPLDLDNRANKKHMHIIDEQRHACADNSTFTSVTSGGIITLV
jgi:hypothetical protein